MAARDESPGPAAPPARIPPPTSTAADKPHTAPAVTAASSEKTGESGPASAKVDGAGSATAPAAGASSNAASEPAKRPTWRMLYGVTRERSGQWRATFTWQGVQIITKPVDEAKMAARAHDQLAIACYGPVGSRRHLNFPLEEYKDEEFYKALFELPPNVRPDVGINDKYAQFNPTDSARRVAEFLSSPDVPRLHSKTLDQAIQRVSSPAAFSVPTAPSSSGAGPSQNGSAASSGRHPPSPAKPGPSAPPSSSASASSAPPAVIPSPQRAAPSNLPGAVPLPQTAAPSQPPAARLPPPAGTSPAGGPSPPPWKPVAGAVPFRASPAETGSSHGPAPQAALPKDAEAAQHMRRLADACAQFTRDAVSVGLPPNLLLGPATSERTAALRGNPLFSGLAVQHAALQELVRRACGGQAVRPLPPAGAEAAAQRSDGSSEGAWPQPIMGQQSVPGQRPGSGATSGLPPCPMCTGPPHPGWQQRPSGPHAACFVEAAKRGMLGPLNDAVRLTCAAVEEDEARLLRAARPPSPKPPPARRQAARRLARADGLESGSDGYSDSVSSGEEDEGPEGGREPARPVLALREGPLQPQLEAWMRACPICREKTERRGRPKLSHVACYLRAARRGLLGGRRAAAEAIKIVASLAVDAIDFARREKRAARGKAHAPASQFTFVEPPRGALGSALATAAGLAMEAARPPHGEKRHRHDTEGETAEEAARRRTPPPRPGGDPGGMPFHAASGPASASWPPGGPLLLGPSTLAPYSQFAYPKPMPPQRQPSVPAQPLSQPQPLVQLPAPTPGAGDHLGSNVWVGPDKAGRSGRAHQISHVIPAPEGKTSVKYKYPCLICGAVLFPSGWGQHIKFCSEKRRKTDPNFVMPPEYHEMGLGSAVSTSAPPKRTSHPAGGSSSSNSGSGSSSAGQRASTPGSVQSVLQQQPAATAASHKPGPAQQLGPAQLLGQQPTAPHAAGEQRPSAAPTGQQPPATLKQPQPAASERASPQPAPWQPPLPTMHTTGGEPRQPPPQPPQTAAEDSLPPPFPKPPMPAAQSPREQEPEPFDERPRLVDEKPRMQPQPSGFSSLPPPPPPPADGPSPPQPLPKHPAVIDLETSAIAPLIELD